MPDAPLPPTPAAPHSAEYLTRGSRRFLWPDDSLALYARRWRLDAVRRALDVGCGVGHWSFALSKVLPGDCALVGVDREAEWVRRAAAAAEALELAGRFRFERADAERLPFADASFDLVTCQTLLMHVPDAGRVLREMVRVLRPGGRLVAVEPANRAGVTLWGSLHVTPDAMAEHLRLYATCERGKAACGEGEEAIGDRLPGLLAALGLHDVAVSLADHAFALFPPYAGEEQAAFVAELRGEVERGIWVWDRETTRRYFLAGGGAEGEFEARWRAALAHTARVLAAIDAGTYSSSGGFVLYLVSGWKG